MMESSPDRSRHQVKPNRNTASPSPECGCTGGCCGESISTEPPSEVSRRNFLQVAGLATLGPLTVAPQLTRAIMAGPFFASEPNGPISHFVPADKKLTPEWIASLTQRGEPRVYRSDKNELKYIAMPIGGITAGQMYLRGDGTLSCWQIFSQQYSSGWGATNYDDPPSTAPIEHGFALVLDDDPSNPGNIKRLGTGGGFGNIAFKGQYPIGIVDYKDNASPVSVTTEAFSPFIPLNAKDSALPATIFNITVRNTSNQSHKVSMFTWLENGVCFHNAAYLRAQRVSRITTSGANGDRCTIEHLVRPMPKNAEPVRPPVVIADFEGKTYGEGWMVEGEAFGAGPAHGTLPNQQRVSGFEGKGLVNSYLGGDEPVGRLTSPEFTIDRHFINSLIGGGNHKGETCIDLIVDGMVVRTATGRNTETLRWSSWDVREFEGRKAKIQIVDANSGGWGHINIDQIEQADESRFGNGGPLDQLEDFGTMACTYVGAGAPGEIASRTAQAIANDVKIPISTETSATFPVNERRCTAMQTAPVTLQPDEQHTFTFILAWHFPNRPDKRGQYYATYAPDASAIASYIHQNLPRLTDDTRLWVKTFYEDSTLPNWLLERLHIPVCNLATGTTQWWKNGRFWAWEGVGCCTGTCTHVWNYAHALARLFPELERSARGMQDLNAALMDNGLVGFRGERNGAYAADGQCGTVLKCYREHLMSADDSFLKRNWTNIKKVLLYLVTQDGNDDGIIENSQPNTYDIDFFGPNTFVGSLYLAALRAGEEMARIIGDNTFADRVHTIFEKGRDYSVKELYNGEYFVQHVDLKAHPRFQYSDGCLSDQLFGQGWANQVGLDYIYPADNVRTTLESIWKYNWAPNIKPQNDAHKPERWFVHAGDAGLFTCTWPKTAYLKDAVRYRNEVWTGIEYQVAGNMIFENMITEGLAIVRAIQDRYDPMKRNPYNEVECGDHYSRAMASWGVYTALCGFEYDGPRGHIGFAPRLSPEKFSAAFTCAEGWGLYGQTVDTNGSNYSIEVRNGQLQVSKVALSYKGAMRDKTVTLNGNAVPAAVRTQGDRLEIHLASPITIETGQRLEIRIL